ncbi:MAG: hypothetical protein ABI140_16215 [Jatrophihabitantaceae bacterium]
MSEAAVSETALPMIITRSARFVLLSDLPAKVARPAGPATPQRVSWRLIAANNRSLGQAGSVFGSVQECIVDIDRLVGSAVEPEGSVHFHDAPASGTGSYWSWTIMLDGRVAANSTHEYRRRIECERALGQFLAAIGDPPSMPRPDRVRRLGDRLGSGPR